MFMYYRQHFLQCGVVLNDENVGTGVIHDVFIHFSTVRRVESSAKSSCEDGAESTETPFWGVEAGDGDRVVWLQTKLYEGSCNLWRYSFFSHELMIQLNAQKRYKVNLNK